MATWRTIIEFVTQDITTTVGTQTPAVKVAGGWPSNSTLQNVGKGLGSAVTIYDRGPSKDHTRFLPFQAANYTMPTPGVTSVLSKQQINPTSTATITIGGTPTFANGDAVGLQVGGAIAPGGAGAVYVIQSGDTINSVATGFAAVINANLTGLITATVASNVITITNAGTVTANVTTATGTSATSLLEIRREKRSLQIVVWANTPNQRDAICDLIEQRLAYLQITFGYQFADLTWGRVTFDGDINIESDVLANVYRRDFIIGLEYAITLADQVYTVLVGANNITFEPAS